MTEKATATRHIGIKVHYFIALLIALHSLFFLVYGFAVGAFRKTVDAYLSGLIGVRLPFVTIVMIFTALIFLATAIRFLGLRLAVKKGRWRPAVPDWIFFVAWGLFSAIFYGGFFVIFWQNPSQKGVVRHLLSLTRLAGDAVLFLVAAVWLRRLIRYLRGRQQAAQKRWPWTVGITLTLVVLVGLWLVPMLFPPSWAYQGDLPTKPALIAHRGASMLAPENTLAALDLSATHQALGFETDLRISRDGVPFLMHDDTLARTTNIAEVFPDRTHARASSFTLDELKMLNAGLWFIQQDPFGTINAGQVSQTQLSINQGQFIPSLAEALDRVREHGMVIMFDMRYPPNDHPFYEDFIEIVLVQCLEARMNSDIWFLLDEAQLPIVLDRAPGMTRVAGVSSTALPAVDALLALDYEIVNVDTGIRTADVRAYRAEGLGVNVYTIDEPWLFSQFWLAGVTSVTTNNVHSFSQLDRPLLNVPYARYVLFWGLFGITLAIWLASSQPEPETVKPENVKSPSLLDLDFGPDVTIIEDAGYTDEDFMDWEAIPGAVEDSVDGPERNVDDDH
jgi:glycerophosphoryl diester phosphodiesterase